MKASELIFSTIIQSGSAHNHYHVPKYQRSYSWNQSNWAHLFDDIQENEQGHFIGSIICINDRISPEPGHDLIFELVDGQQRMTTIAILLAAILKTINRELKKSDPLTKFDEEDRRELESSAVGIERQLVKRVKKEFADQPGTLKIGKHSFLLRTHPSTQNWNEADFLYILHHCGALNQDVKRPRYFGNRLVAKAYRYFQLRISDNIDETMELLEKINKLQIVFISVDSHANAFRLFETLNNRGVPLTAIDLIKNKMLAEMDRQHNFSIDEAYELWQEMLEDVEDHEDRFLRHFYNAFKHLNHVGQNSSGKRATTSTLITLYERMIQNGARTVFRDLIEKATIYSKIISPDENDEIGESLVNIGRIGATPVNCLLLYLLSISKSSFENENTFNKILDFLAKYYVRRNVTNVPGTRDLDQLQIDMIDKCEEWIKYENKIEFDRFAKFYCSSKGVPAPIEDFKDALENDLYLNNRQMARYLLVKLDERAHSREYKPDLWARNNKGSYIWTVEHIFPQGENIPDDWVQMVAGGDRERASEIQEQVVHNLGNLTLSGYNARLSNQSFVKKQSKTEKTHSGQNLDIGYKNGLYLNNLIFEHGSGMASLSQITEWTKASILSRNLKMSEILCEEYLFEHEKHD